MVQTGVNVASALLALVAVATLVGWIFGWL